MLCTVPLGACGGMGRPTTAAGGACPLKAGEKPSAFVRDDRIYTPGVGIGEIRLGVSTPEDVLRAYGCDAYVVEKDGLYIVDYGLDPNGHYEPKRAGSLMRPEQFRFRSGKLVHITVGPHQGDLRTSKGAHVEGSIAGYIDELGPQSWAVPEHGFVRYRFAVGLEVIATRDGTVRHAYVVPAGDVPAPPASEAPPAASTSTEPAASAPAPKLDEKPALDKSEPFVLAEGNDWKRDGKQVLWPASASEPSLYVSALELKGSSAPLAQVPKARLSTMFNTSLRVDGTPAQVDGVPAIEFQTDSSYGKPAGALGHTWDVERCVVASNGTFCLRCGQYAAMKGPSEASPSAARRSTRSS